MIRSMKEQGVLISEIARKLGISRTTVRIYEELRKKGFKGSYSLVKQYSRPIRTDRKILAVYRYETDPGKQSQVDFGEFGYIHIDGKRRKLYPFSMIPGYSRMRYAEFTTDISTRNVIWYNIFSQF